MNITNTARRVLLYGDSFFWGVDPTSNKRYQPTDRVAGAAQAQLGASWEVVEAGHRGRTMFGENGWFPERNGLEQFGPTLASQLPLDAVVIMLGTNDLNTKTHHTPGEIAAALQNYQEKMVYWCEFIKVELPQLIVVAPPAIHEDGLTDFRDIFIGTSQEIEPLAQTLQEASRQLKATFLNAGEFVSPQATDGIHLTAVDSRKLGKAIAEVILQVS